MSEIVYIYALVEPLSLERRYIGQTTNPIRRLYNHCHTNDRTAKAQWISDLKEFGLRPDIEILARVHPSEANKAESDAIRLNGGVSRLLNVADPRYWPIQNAPDVRQVTVYREFQDRAARVKARLTSLGMSMAGAARGIGYHDESGTVYVRRVLNGMDTSNVILDRVEAMLDENEKAEAA